MSTRYRLQEAFKPLGPESTKQLSTSHVLVIGCGATGSHAVDTLARMGVSILTLIDPDVVESENLHRQLYTEADVGKFKAEVLADHVVAINSEVSVRAILTRITADNIVGILERENLPVNLILDCTDNMETRWLINEFAVKHSIPWIYCGVGQSKGMSMAYIPGKTACLRCIFSPTDKQEKPSGGIFPPAVAIMANVQAAIAVKILTGHTDDVSGIRHFDVWTCNWMTMNTQPKPDCPVCGKPYKVGDKVLALDISDYKTWLPGTVVEIPARKKTLIMVEFENGMTGGRTRDEIKWPTA